ncbi:unnamed protein product [Peronospora belbahrii]|uniref:Uncharacterized protein n=1 Tax=Peronospora belbahrii TaxID=622444 RepID=A0ABN8D2G7_9STRA|nr:unnamed protein product [Peronospora belbahrii]
MRSSPREKYTPDITMESVGSCHTVTRHTESPQYDPNDLSLDIPRRPSVETAEAIDGGGIAAQRIGVSVIIELQELAANDKEEDRARVWNI